MPRSLKQSLKILTSGCLFSCLGVGGVLCTLLFCPLLFLVPGSPDRRQRRMRAAIRTFFRLFVLGLERSGILTVEMQGLPKNLASEGCLILANHPSYLDVVVLIAFLPDVLCVVKEGVWKNPCFGPLVRAAGFIPNHGDPEEVLAQGCTALAQGKSLVIFPEGTRSRPEAPPNFQRGAAHLALRSGAPILPLSIQVTPPLLVKGDRWYDIPAQTVLFRITAGARILPEPAGAEAGPGRQARALTRDLEAHYSKDGHALVP